MAKGQKRRQKTDANVKKLEEALRGGCTRESAYSYAGISKQTFYNWLKEVPDFLTLVEDSEEYRIKIVEDAKRKQIEKGNRQAIEKELKSRRRNVYGDSTEINTNGTINIVLQQYSSLPQKS